MLEKAIDDGDDVDGLAHVCYAWPERADATDIQADPYAALRCGIQGPNDLLVGERIHLRDDLGRLPGLRAPSFPINQLQEPSP